MVKKVAHSRAGSGDRARCSLGDETAHTSQSLNQQVKALQGQVKKLQKQVADLQDYNSCDTVFAVARFGDAANGTFGYLFGQTDNSVFATTALDYLDDPTKFDPALDKWFTTVDPNCVQASRGVPQKLGRTK